MAEGNTSSRQSKSRSVLSDLTNRIGKRGFSVREKNEGKCFDSNFKDKNEAKRICVSPLQCSEIHSLKGNIISGLSKIPNESRDPNLSCSGDISNQIDCSNVYRNLVDKEGADKADVHGRIELDSSKESKNLGIASELVNENKGPNLELSVGKNVVGLTITDGSEFVKGILGIHSKDDDVIEAEDELGDSFSADTSKTVSETGNNSIHNGKICDGGEVNISLSDIHSEQNDLDDHNGDNFILSQSGSVDCTILPQSQESRVFGIEKSTKVKEDECDHMIDGDNSIRACSCSFCTKAAYIWLDLQQKDVKARLSALKKSQKDASILGEKSCRIKAIGPESSNRASKLESHLMYQWRSLFKYMGNTWEEEANQLEANLLQLNNLKAKCKAELELNNSSNQKSFDALMED